MTGHCWDDVLGPAERAALDGYRAPRSFRRARALLLVDLYNKAFAAARAHGGPTPSDPAGCGPAAQRTLPVLQRLLAAARRHRVPVVYTVGDLDVPTGDAGTLRSTPDAPERRQWGNQVVDGLAPRPGEVVLPKARASAFFGTVLDAHLRRLGVDALVVAGETTSGCVRATAVDAFSLGFDVAVVEEATFDRSPLSHKVSLFDLHCKYATVVHEDDAIRLLEHDHPTVLEMS
jgi:maleamate amidohydrolase